MFEVTGNTNGRPINETELLPVVKFYHKCDEDDKKVPSSQTIFGSQV